MEKRIIDRRELLKYKDLKDRKVFLVKDEVYKLSDDSEEIVDKLDSVSGNSCFNQIILPKSKLIDRKHKFLGHVTDYKTDVLPIDSIVNYKDKLKFLRDCITLEEEFNKYDLSYWDCFKDNVRIDKNGMPFFLDFDDMVISPTTEDILKQNDFMAMFIYCYLLGVEDSMYFSYLTYYSLRDDTLPQKLVNELLDLDDNKERAMDAHYHLLEVLSDESKAIKIKKYLKNTKVIS